MGFPVGVDVEKPGTQVVHHWTRRDCVCCWITRDPRDGSQRISHGKPSWKEGMVGGAWISRIQQKAPRTQKMSTYY